MKFPSLAALSTMVILATATSAAPPSPTAAAGSPETPALPAHPRLVATAADFDRIRVSITEPGPLRETFELLGKTVASEYDEPPLSRRIIGDRLLYVARNSLRRILNGAMLYRLTGEKKWAGRAEREMLALAAFSDWHPRHFLGTAEIATAVAIGYDWTYDTLSPESRRILKDALVKHALKPGDNDKLFWRPYRNNWIQICESGLALAALVVAEDEPELAARALARARRNVPVIFHNYEPSGAYLEGTMYWDYGTTYHVLLVEALRHATGSAGPLADNPAFLQSAGVVNILTGPTGACFNFGDSRAQRLFSPAMYWFARETRRPDIVADEHTRMYETLRNEPFGSDSGPFPSRFLAFSLLWMPPGPAATVPSQPRSWSTQGANPLAVFRQGEGRDALYAGIKGGRARMSHGHMDAGGFLLEAGGVRWTSDLGMPSYQALEAAGIKLFGEDRWKVYALGPHSHSIPLIDDTPPDEQATATLAKFSEEPQSAVIDLSPLYASQAKNLKRELRIESANTITIRDELDGAAPGGRYRFSWMTHAHVETDATGATLSRDGKRLRLSVSADTPFEIVNEDASQPRAPHDAPQPGLRRLGVLFTIRQPHHSLSVTARLMDNP